MLNLTGGTWIRFGVWMVIGLVVYLLYGYRNSRIGEHGDQEPGETLAETL
jgi:APA family basic amino acid/polyamine antiporter